jgi:hypothetical protein
MRRSLTLGVAICMAAVTGLLATASACAAQSDPAWNIEVIPYPSAFQSPSSPQAGAPSPGYQIQVYNAGGGQTSGEFKITDKLPKGLLPAPGFPPTGTFGRSKIGLSRNELSCSAVGRQLTCTGGAAGPPLYPGEEASVVLPVVVEEHVIGPLVDEATVKGGGAAGAVATAQPTPVSAASSPFGFLPEPAGLNGFTSDADGSASTQAGSHPYQMTVAAMALTTNTSGFPASSEKPLYGGGGGLHEAVVTLPSGTVVNPAATPKCKESELESGEAGCPSASQVGTIAITLSLASGSLGQLEFSPLYNMVPPTGHPAELGFEVVGLEGVYVHLIGSVSSDGTFTLSASGSDVLAKAAIAALHTTLWGVPSDASHDAQRGDCVFGSRTTEFCETERTGRAFLTLPSSCGGPLTTDVKADGWDQRGTFVDGRYQSVDSEGNPVGVEGCNALQFEPTIEAKATTNQGEAPSGLEFDLHQTQHESGEELATANLKDATVALPEGMALNPSAAGGLDACTSAQAGVTTAPGATPIRYLEEPAHCPDASKLGTAEVTTPVLVDEPSSGVRTPHVLKGSVYLAKPFDNPFGSLLGIYLVVEDEQTGIIAKLAGRVTPDPTTGRLTTTFEESPELPLEDVRLHLYEGARAALTTPLTCGTKTTASTLTPWSAPEGADAHPTATFQTEGSCFASEAQAPKTVSFTAGTESPLSGAFSPFVLRLSRPDGSQHITGLETTLPEGLLGKLAGVSYCPESGIAQAISREHPEQGKLEQASPSCPSSSEVGTVNVTAGSGTSPVAVSGHAYLAGPYKGAALSLVVIVPAVTGPFDLGTVVDRVALRVGEYDARIHAVADPLPTIREGIPLDVRSIELKLTRSNFTLNPTSCEVKAIEGSVSTQAGQSASLNNRFQVGECGRLAFTPKLAISLKGTTKRTGHPALKATVTYPQGGAYANIARAQVSLPHSEFLDQGNIGGACTKPVLQAHGCPAKSIYGKAKAWSPLLAQPLEGPVYLVGGYGYKLPALVAELDGQIRVLLVGKVDTGKNNGIRNTFEAVPDAPVEKFVFELKGGKKYGLLENSEDVCRKTQRAQVSFTAQNGKALGLSPVIANSCKGGSKRKKAHGNTKGSKKKL